MVQLQIKSIKKIIKKYKRKIYLIDDCSQAHGAIDVTNNQKKNWINSRYIMF